MVCMVYLLFFNLVFFIFLLLLFVIFIDIDIGQDLNICVNFLRYEMFFEIKTITITNMKNYF